MTINTKDLGGVQEEKGKLGLPPKWHIHLDFLLPQLKASCGLFIPCLRLAALSSAYRGCPLAAVGGEALLVHFWGAQGHLVVWWAASLGQPSHSLSPKCVNLFLIKKQEKERELKGWGGAGLRREGERRSKRQKIRNFHCLQTGSDLEFHWNYISAAFSQILVTVFLLSYRNLTMVLKY